MKLFLKTMILGLALIVGLGVMVIPKADAAYYHYEISVYSDEGFTTAAGGTTLITSGITYQVLTAASDTEATIYSDTLRTAMTNPVTTTVFDATAGGSTVGAGRIDFYTTAASCDIIVVNTAGGYTVFLDGATARTRTAIIDERPNVMHHGMIWFASTTSSTEVDTEIEFDKDTAIHNVILEIVTIDSDVYMDVGLASGGTNGDSDGFIDGAMMGTAGFKNPRSMYGPLGGTGQTALSSGASEQYHWIGAASYLGALLGTIVTGNDDTAECEGEMLYYDAYIDATDEQSLIYVYAQSASDTAAGYIHYFFTRLR